MILLLVLSHHPPSSSVEKRASLQSSFLLFERSKLHQVDGEVCFTCHSVELPPNEMLHTDFCLRAQGDKTVVTEWNKPLPIAFTHKHTRTYKTIHRHTHMHTAMHTHTRSCWRASMWGDPNLQFIQILIFLLVRRKVPWNFLWVLLSKK